MSRRHIIRRLVAGTALVGLAAAVPTASASASPKKFSLVQTDSAPVEVIIRSTDGDIGALAALVESVGGEVDDLLPIIGGLSAFVPATAVAGLEADPMVLTVTPDADVTLSGSSDPDILDDEEDAGELDWIRHVTGANAMHDAGFYGDGIDVAMVDSGVARVRGWEESPKVLIGPDVSFEKNNPELYGKDSFGHGTHLGGIINGDDDKDHDDLGNRYGIAPGARLVSIKAADATGTTDVSQVIAAIDWVVQHGRSDGLNIRVLNLAFGTDARQSYVLDPLSYAVENAWKKGIVVVVAAGNRGATRVGLDNPATNPFVIAVGASDTNGTATAEDDTVPDWSAKGNGERNPDFVAPGTSVVSFRVKHSFVDHHFGEIAKEGKNHFRGSGTSQSSAVTSGLVALLLDANPLWTPDQVKKALVDTAQPMPLGTETTAGSGLVDVHAAATHTPGSGTQLFVPAVGTGSLDAARGSVPVEVGETVIDGERTAFGQVWNAGSWSAGSWSGDHWNGGSWSGGSWSGGSWSAGSWSAGSWSSGSWSGGSWSGARWTGEEWSSGSWSGSEWNSNNWNGSRWG